MPSQTPDGLSGLTQFSVSANGRFVAFYSDADDLAPNDTNGCDDVFVRDLVAGANILVSVNTNGNASGDGLSTDPSISSNGQYVVFTSSADNLVPGGTNEQNVYLRDLQAGTTALVSVSTNGVDPGNGDSFSPIISADGRYVLFHSKASNLATGSFGSGIENLFFRDLQTGTTYALTAATSGTGVYSASMTPDGHSVAFIGTAAETSGDRIICLEFTIECSELHQQPVFSFKPAPGCFHQPQRTKTGLSGKHAGQFIRRGPGGEHRLDDQPERIFLLERGIAIQ